MRKIGKRKILFKLNKERMQMVEDLYYTRFNKVYYSIHNTNQV
jgi:hypothetical protein